MIYEPSEDSYLLQEQVKKYSNEKDVLDIGTGSGIQAQTALKFGAKSVLATDVSSEAVKHVRNKKINSKKSNLFSSITGKYDLIIFNPPYLPKDVREDEESRLITTGGKKGDELILNFLKKVKDYLTKEGMVLILISSQTPQKRIFNLMLKLKLKKEKIAEKKIFMEKLEVWKIKSIKEYNNQ